MKIEKKRSCCCIQAAPFWQEHNLQMPGRHWHFVIPNAIHGEQNATRMQCIAMHGQENTTHMDLTWTLDGSANPAWLSLGLNFTRHQCYAVLVLNQFCAGMWTEIHKMWEFDKVHKQFWHFVGLHAILCYNQTKMKLSLYCERWGWFWMTALWWWWSQWSWWSLRTTSTPNWGWWWWWCWCTLYSSHSRCPSALFPDLT